ncbi:MAG TPA: FtsQ-type POTRA domain-containing protein [Burkholderiaceae bacterium]|nr:FtsQ-type POTRA domain-containing protein [Burkholderiaceae bacterium]
MATSTGPDKSGTVALWMERAARALTVIAVLAVCGGALVWIAQRPYFDIRHVEVRGQLRHVDVDDVRAVFNSAARPAGNFFTVSLDDARRAFETVPWVAQAAVRRRWPDRLVVTLTEHRALGIWSDGQLVSDQGLLFAANPGEAETENALVSFEGPPELAPEAVRRFHAWSARLAPLSLAITAIDVSERVSWTVTTDSGQRFQLGRDDPPGRIDETVARLVAAYPLVVARLGNAPTRIDLRYPNGFAAAAAQERSRR